MDRFCIVRAGENWRIALIERRKSKNIISHIRLTKNGDTEAVGRNDFRLIPSRMQSRASTIFERGTVTSFQELIDDVSVLS